MNTTQTKLPPGTYMLKDGGWVKYDGTDVNEVMIVENRTVKQIVDEALQTQTEEYRKRIEEMKISQDKVEESINKSFNLRIKSMRKIKKDYGWNREQWNEWHRGLMDRKGKQLVLMRKGISVKNKTLDDVLDILKETK